MTVAVPNPAVSLDRYAPLLGTEVEELRALARPLEGRSVLMVKASTTSSSTTPAFSAPATP